MRIVLVYPAELMNIMAANAFLKVLEEPPEGVLFILVSHRHQTLLATIKSRCRRFNLPLPSEKEALTWLNTQQISQAQIQLRHYGGAPLLACGETHNERSSLLNYLLEYLSQPKKTNVMTLAVELDKLKAQTIDIVDCLQKWVLDSILYQNTGKVRYYPDYESVLSRQGIFGVKLWDFYDMLLHARRYAEHPLNQRLLLEKIFYTWIDVLKEAHTA